MASVGQAACPVDADFDPLSPAFLADPFAVLSSLARETSVFYAPSIDYYVVTRYVDIERVFLDHETYSAAPAQRPLVQLVPEAAQILLAGGHQPQPSMVSLDPPAHARLRSPTARAFTPRRVEQMEPRIRATVDQLLNTIDPLVPFDLVSTLSFPLPATIIFSFVGYLLRCLLLQPDGQSKIRAAGDVAADVLIEELAAGAAKTSHPTDDGHWTRLRMRAFDHQA